MIVLLSFASLSLSAILLQISSWIHHRVYRTRILVWRPLSAEPPMILCGVLSQFVCPRITSIRKHEQIGFVIKHVESKCSRMILWLAISAKGIDLKLCASCTLLSPRGVLQTISICWSIGRVVGMIRVKHYHHWKSCRERGGGSDKVSG